MLIQAEKKLETFEKAGKFITGPHDIPKSKDFDDLTDEEIDQMHRLLLKAGGIDIDGQDELAELRGLVCVIAAQSEYSDIVRISMLRLSPTALYGTWSASRQRARSYCTVN